ncbi:hypothetical protein JTE90_020256 [Oedothorax gibbosus]|uniref:LRRCT domain-containing protein n=1 Tax=Oedothorax gibbosus TaxID=931172 RepID=A0AAV6U122_9ARAC|nr:hypothetical protein JTE90_020256 [Oedothorax gibbosus]
MERGKTIFVWACLFVVVPIVLTAECPSKEDVFPCTCRDYSYGVGVQCDKIGVEVLVRVASNFRGKNVDYFTITNSEFGFIPYDVFKGIKLREFGIENSTLAALTDKDEAFVGLEEELEEISITSCVFDSEWDWSVLRSLKKLKYLTIEKSLHLRTLGTDVMKSSLPSSLKYFSFSGNNISSVSDHAFDSFKEVTNLYLGYNRIRNVKRTMFPNPSWNLYFLDISGNLIEEIPKDMFTRMMNLRFLNIRYNKILVLNQVTFSPVWDRLAGLFVSGNPLRCDCSMSWILVQKAPDNFPGECASPPELEGKKLTKLESKDFVCNVQNRVVNPKAKS